MTFSCAEAFAEVSAEYEDMPLTTRAGKALRLRNLLMLSDEGLKTAVTLLGTISGSDMKDIDSLTRLMPAMRDLLLLIADKPAELKKEVSDWPLGMYMHVIDEWQKVTQMGEASDSDD